jgi:hypothetical protein
MNIESANTFFEMVQISNESGEDQESIFCLGNQGTYTSFHQRSAPGTHLIIPLIGSSMLHCSCGQDCSSHVLVTRT